MLPTIKLSYKDMAKSLLKPPKELGMMPLNEFEYIFNDFKFVNNPNSEGRDPNILLPANCTVSKLYIWPIDDGIVPIRLFPCRFNLTTCPPEQPNPFQFGSHTGISGTWSVQDQPFVNEVLKVKAATKSHIAAVSGS
jgi:hypothetical protein